MAKLLSGTDLVGYIQERQARQVRALRQGSRVFPKLAIIKSTSASDVINVYIRMKQKYGDEILIETVVETLDEADMPAAIQRLNKDATIHGIIVQLPLSDTGKTEEIVNLVAPEKDVDGLGVNAQFDSATADAINWLLAGYAVDLKAKKIAIVGNGRLVGAPLARRWAASGLDVTVLDRSHADIADTIKQSDIIVTGTGVPGIITTDMVGIGAVVIDAGTASENGVIRGDVDPAVRERDDIKITPEKGGVGPLTITALFDHVIQVAEKQAALKV
jgi:methylenetetrahydrofolate dehydrogenase (NADP+)/methenyltetrahydrofolate cyclohydrolase